MKKWFSFIVLALLFSTTAFAQEGDGHIWQPKPGTCWQWQLNDEVNTSWDVTMYDIDLFDTPQTTIDKLHTDGRIVICYFSAGSWEEWREDARDFPDEVLGEPLEEWEDERWLDISRIDLLEPIMLVRLNLAVAKNCDGVEPDNVDGYTNETGFDLTYDDQLEYNLWLAEQAHQRGLSIGLKNDLDQIDEVVDDFDWALNEECFQFDECDELLPFIEAGKAVFGVEYVGDPEDYCPQAIEMGFSWLTKTLNLGNEPPGACTSEAATADEQSVKETTRSDGAELIYLPEAPASAQNAAFSPDGQTILFTIFDEGYNAGPAGLYLLSEKSEPVPLQFEEEYDSVNVPGSSWSPVTNRITFASDREDTDEVWTIAPDGNNLARVTRHDGDTYFIEPTFSPDGEWIVFEVDNDAPEEDLQGSIWKVRGDGTGLTQLTDGPTVGTDDRLPNWSPVDADQILFQRRMVGTDVWNLYVINADGGDIRQITDSSYGNTDASWSADGQWIVYSTDHGGLEHPSIFIVSVTGSEPIRVTNDPDHENGAPSWSPDGQWIYFESHTTTDEESRSGIWRIAVSESVSR